jgi:Ca-activated chloride channel family protein
VTALYEVLPVGVESSVPVAAVDELKYQTATEPSEAAGRGELLTVSLRYKLPDEEQSTLMTVPVADGDGGFHGATRDFKHAAAVALFGMLLRGSEYQGDGTYDSVLQIAQETAENDARGYRTEFVELVRRASEIGRGERR